MNTVAVTPAGLHRRQLHTGTVLMLRRAGAGLAWVLAIILVIGAFTGLSSIQPMITGGVPIACFVIGIIEIATYLPTVIAAGGTRRQWFVSSAFWAVVAGVSAMAALVAARAIGPLDPREVLWRNVTLVPGVVVVSDRTAAPGSVATSVTASQIVLVGVVCAVLTISGQLVGATYLRWHWAPATLLLPVTSMAPLAYLAVLFDRAGFGETAARGCAAAVAGLLHTAGLWLLLRRLPIRAPRR